MSTTAEQSIGNPPATKAEVQSPQANVPTATGNTRPGQSLKRARISAHTRRETDQVRASTLTVDRKRGFRHPLNMLWALLTFIVFSLGARTPLVRSSARPRFDR